MRFGAVHKLASYLMAASAFAAIALSGELSPPWTIATLLLGLASYFVDPALPERFVGAWWARAWNAATLLLFAGSIAAALRGDPFLLVGVHFLCFLLVNKLWNLRAAKDWLQAYVVTFLMLVAGTTLNTDLVYAACFVGYVVFTTWSLTLFHLRREMEENYLLKHSLGAQSQRVEVERILNSRRVVGPAFLAGSSLISLGIFLGSTLIFFLFPRVGFGLFFQQHRPGLRMGFSDTGVELGQNGLIKDNEQVVLRVELPGGRPAQALYFRGVAFERYARSPDGRTAAWSPEPGRHRKELPRYQELSLPRGLYAVGEKPADALRGAVEQTIYLEPMGEVSVLFAAAQPMAYRFAPAIPGLPSTLLPEGTPLGDVHLAGRQLGIRYTALSRLVPPATALLAAQGDLPLDEVDHHRASLQVPADLPPRIIELARTITAGAEGPWAKSEAIRRHLAARFRYTTRLSRDFRFDPLEDFLFVQRAGHCEYFATAHAILLRAVGVPARHVAGFYGGEWNGIGNYLQVRQRDAHAWVEVWVGRAGWVPVDPTPPSDEGAEGGLGSRMRQLLDVFELAWFKYVIEYDLGKQVDFVLGLRRFFSGDGAGGAKGGSLWDSLRRHRVAVGIVAAALALWVVARRRRGGAGAKVVRTRQQAQALQALERALRALAGRGVSHSVGDTPREVERRAKQAGDAGAAAFAELVELYYAARFGAQAIDGQRLDELARRVVDPTAGPPL